MSEVIVPDQVIAGPGMAEAAKIRANYEVAMKGMRAFVDMGFQLIEVKSRLPHGKFMAWVEHFLPDLCHRHLHRARSIAAGFAEMAGVKLDSRVQFDELPPEIVEQIDGATGYRALLAAIHEFRSDELETKNRELCEARWKADPELRDEWEPRVLSGEVTYTYAMRGMTGQELKGAARPRVDYGKITLRNLTSQPIAWKHWDSFPAEYRNEILLKVPALVEGAPMIVLATLQKEIERRWNPAATPTA